MRNDSGTRITGRAGTAARILAIGATLSATTVGTVVWESAASAAPSEVRTVCTDGPLALMLTIRDNVTRDAHSAENGGWAAVRILSGGSGTMIPTSFTLTAVDSTTGEAVFSATEQKGAGNANHNRAQTLTCTDLPQTETLGDIWPAPFGPYPDPDMNATDQVALTFSGTAVRRP
jgi:hypothetical protein